jgi:DNA-3-methyladenine glycosylase
LKNELNKILEGSSLEAAPQLLGWTLARETPEGVIKLKIVETEAYHQDDPASHSFRGITKRTTPMFEAGGLIYVYFTYGAHYCINIVTGKKGTGEAVLLRAAEPLEGIEIMQQNRGSLDIYNLASGPGKLAQALGIKSTDWSGKPLGKSTVYLEPPAQKIKAKDIITSPRIGISQAKDVPWRFYIKDNNFVSKLTRRPI